jgi:hypothetical protein
MARKKRTWSPTWRKETNVQVFFWLIFLLCVAKGVTHALKAREDAQLRKEHPDVWVQKKAIEEGEKQRKHERANMGLRAGGALGQIVLKHFLK